MCIMGDIMTNAAASAALQVINTSLRPATMTSYWPRPRDVDSNMTWRVAGWTMRRMEGGREGGMGCDVSDGEIDLRYMPFPDQHRAGRGVIYQPTACCDRVSVTYQGPAPDWTLRRLNVGYLPLLFPFPSLPLSLSLSSSTWGETSPRTYPVCVVGGSGGPQHGIYIYSQRLTRVSP